MALPGSKMSMPKVFMALVLMFVLKDNVFAHARPISGTTSSGGGTTAQSVMATLTQTGNLLITGTVTYRFNASDIGEGTEAPVFYYTNGQVNCSASGSATLLTVGDYIVSYTSNGPKTTIPTEAQLIAAAQSNLPLPIASKTADHIESNKDNNKDWEVFADGGPTANLTSMSYEQQSSNVLLGSKTVQFTYCYLVAPKPDLTFPALTGWSVASDETRQGYAQVTIFGMVAGESLLYKDLKTKYSFSLMANGTSRVQNLNVSIEATDPITNLTIWSSWNAPAHNVVNNANPLNYVANPGLVYGSDSATKAMLKDGDAVTILNTDGFEGNNNGGADGSALQKANLAGSHFDVPPGNVVIRLTGSVKDNTAAATLGFDVRESIKIIYRNPGGNNGSNP